MRGFFLLVALRECGAFLAGVFLPAPGAREKGRASNRLATVFFYLTEVAEGGETGCPRAGGRCHV